MFDLLTVHVVAEERIKDALREAEQARLIRQAGWRGEPRRWRSAVASFLKRLPILAARPQSASAGLLSPTNAIAPCVEPSQAECR